MFKQLREEDKASRLTKVAGEYEEGLKLYKAFKEALEDQDKSRAPRLGIKIDSYYNSLTQPQRHEFCALLVQNKLVTGTLATALTTFNAALVKIGKE